MSRSMIILYVQNQARARGFWAALSGAEPVLDVPGMTEFELPGGLLVGLMPELGIRHLLPRLDECFMQTENVRPPRAELYLLVDEPEQWLNRALQAGARILDDLRPRPWGDEAAYVLDPDGHVLAFATERSGSSL